MRTPDELDSLDIELDVQQRINTAVTDAITFTLNAFLEMMLSTLLERQALLELASIEADYSAQSQLACVIHSEASCLALGLEPAELLTASSGLRLVVTEAIEEADARWELTGWPADHGRRAVEVGAAATRVLLPAILPSTP